MAPLRVPRMICIASLFLTLIAIIQLDSSSNFELASVVSVVEAAQLPPVWPTYSAQIFHSYQELGFSESYTEYRDNKARRYRFDGRFGGGYETYISYGTWQMSNGIRAETGQYVYTWDLNNTTATPACLKYPKHPSEDGSLLYGPSIQRLTFLSKAKFFPDWKQTATATNWSTEARGIPCEVYENQLTLTIPRDITLFSNVTYEDDPNEPQPVQQPWSLYKQVIDPSGSLALCNVSLQLVFYHAVLRDSVFYNSVNPVRLVVKGTYSLYDDTNPTATYPFNHVLDWSLWYPTASSDVQIWFAPPIGAKIEWDGVCARNETDGDVIQLVSLDIGFPSSSQVVQAPPLTGTLPPLPSLPTQFHMVLESKFTDAFNGYDPIMNATAAARVRSTSWDYDSQTGKQFFQYLDVNGYYVGMLYDTDLSPSSSTGGTVYVASFISLGYGFGTYICYAENIIGGEVNPLQQARAGAIPLLFGASSANFTAGAEYVGRQYIQRGIEADVWNVLHTGILNGDSTFSFTTSLFFTPGGWKEGNSQKLQQDARLIRIVNNGIQTRLVSGRSSFYEDTWDVFSLLDGKIDPLPTGKTSVFLPANIGCNEVKVVNETVFPFLTTQDIQKLNTYSAAVEYVDALNGKTLTWTEYRYTTGSSSSLRTDGKLSDTNQAEFIDLLTGEVFHVNLIGEGDSHSSMTRDLPLSLGIIGAFTQAPSSNWSDSCTKAGTTSVNITSLNNPDPTLLSSDRDPLLAPILTYFTMLPPTLFTYTGRPEYRRSPSDLYVAQKWFSVYGGDLIVTQSIWFSIPEAGQYERIPLGTELRAVFKNADPQYADTVRFHIIINLHNLQFSDPNGLLNGLTQLTRKATSGETGSGLIVQDVFDVLQTDPSKRGRVNDGNTECQLNATYLQDRFTRWNASSSITPPDPTQDTISFSSASEGFSVHFESRLSANGTSSQTDDQIYSIRWYVDFVNRRERIDVAPSVTLDAVSPDPNLNARQIKSFIPYSLVYFYGDDGAGNTGAMNSATSPNVTIYKLTQLQQFIDTPWFLHYCEKAQGNAASPLPDSMVSPLLLNGARFTTGFFQEMMMSFRSSATAQSFFQAQGFPAYPTSIQYGAGGDAQTPAVGSLDGYRGYTASVFSSVYKQQVSRPVRMPPQYNGSYFLVSSQDLILAPGYWRYPGRTNHTARGQSESIPIKYIQRGSFASTADAPVNETYGQIPFVLSYDIISFLPSRPSLDLFNIIDAGCGDIEPWIQLFANISASSNQNGGSGGIGGSTGGSYNDHTNNDNNDDDNNRAHRKKVIIAAVIASILGVGLIILLVLFFYRQRQIDRSADGADHRAVPREVAVEHDDELAGVGGAASARGSSAPSMIGMTNLRPEGIKDSREVSVSTSRQGLVDPSRHVMLSDDVEEDHEMA